MARLAKEMTVTNQIPYHVLVVDDEEGIRIGAERILSRMGCRVTQAANGAEGLKIIETDPPLIVLLDMKMPGIDGMEVLQRIQTFDSEILVIVITGFATLETAVEAMKRGAYDFIPKPFTPDQLRIVVNRAMEKVRLREQAEVLARERERTLLDLDREQSRLRTIVDSLPSGLFVTNTEGIVVLMNPACRQDLELPPDTATGRPIDTYIDDDRLCSLVLDISRGRHIDTEDIPSYEFSPASDKFLMARCQPVRGAAGQCLGALVNLVDITTLKVLDRLKSEFVAKVSHELRSPLATIHEQLALVLSDMIGQVSESDQHLLSRAKEKTRGLISLIGDLLDLSRIESGTVCQAPKPVQVEKLLADIVDFLQARALAKTQTLTFDAPADPLPPIEADPLALESIFGNLITNAINYTQEEGRIRVTAAHVGPHLRVRVMDNGFGIEPRHLERIFERFYRVKNDRTRFITGTGLGLPIVKGLVDALGGLIQVESKPDAGSTFTVLIPVKTSTDA
jgi:two-component system, OmpR family, phosphate regulon sensor histidine kinase PhoR